MDVDEIVAVISAGMCSGDKQAECSTCQRKLRAIEAVRAMGAVCEAARELSVYHRNAKQTLWGGVTRRDQLDAEVRALDALRGDR